MRPEKKSIVEEIRGQLNGTGFVFLADYRGMTVEQMTAIRQQLGAENSELHVVRNSFFKVAADELGYADAERFLSGPTAAVTGAGDVVRVAKLIAAFVKTNNNLPVIKGGFLGRTPLSVADVEALASLPSREAMLGKFLGTLAAPMSGLVGVMKQKVASIVNVLHAYEQKKAEAN